MTDWKERLQAPWKNSSMASSCLGWSSNRSSTRLRRCPYLV